MRFYHVVIFITGAITLSLELLASRILTPFFGVSLYIWSGILSITLVALAAGYWWGGKLSARTGGDVQSRLVYYFGLMPAVSSLSLVLACLIYPKLFFSMATLDLVLGAFAACGILLLVPLVTVSAMNPLLIAIRAAAARQRGPMGDAGAGHVYFISTMGSVVGVLATAFVIIPNWTNFRSVLGLAALSAGLSLALAVRERILTANQKKWLVTLALAGGISSLGLMVLADRYLNKNAPIVLQTGTLKLIKEVSSFYGNIKVVRMTPPEGSRPAQGAPQWVTYYMVDGYSQSMVHHDGRSGVAYTYGLEALARGVMPEPGRILVLGLGGGILPMRFASPEVEIDVVDIDPEAARLAKTYFQYRPSVAQLHVADARIYVRRCQKQYDLVFVDLFQSDSTPEHLLTVEFLRDLARCLTPRGAVVFNTIATPLPSADSSYYCFLKTVHSVLPELLVYYGRPDVRGNIFLAASRAPMSHFEADLSYVPELLRPDLQKAFVSPKPIDRELLKRATVLTDEWNIYPIINAQEYLKGRRHLTEIQLPPELLVN